MTKQDHALVPLAHDDLADVRGGFGAGLAQMATNAYTRASSALHNGFGLRPLYHGAVKDITAVGGGWQLANQMYGDAQHGAPLAEKWRAIKAFKGYLDSGTKLPSWAPNW